MSGGNCGLALALMMALTMDSVASADGQRLARPHPKALHDSISGGNCLISSGARDEIVALLFALDQENVKMLAEAGVEVEWPGDMRVTVLAGTKDLPPRVPECARNIIYGLRLQVVMLEMVALARGVANDRSYKAHRVLDPQTEAVFGDFRDRFIGLLYTPLVEIAAALTMLDGKPRPRIAMPVNHMAPAELERRYVSDLRLIADGISSDDEDSIVNDQMDKNGPPQPGRRSGG